MNDIKIKEGILLHEIKTNKFKTNIVSIFLTKQINRDEVTKNALIPAILRLGTKAVKTQKEINKRLEEMYGANFNCGIEKRGDNQVLKFYIESIDDEYSLNKEKILKESINLLIDIVFNPLVEEKGFIKKYVESEKESLRRIINGKIDNKANYAYTRCIEEMYKNESYGLFEYGYIEDLEKINPINLFEYYSEFINSCKIDIFVSGKTDEVIEDFTNNNVFSKLLPRNPKYLSNSIQNAENVKEKEIEEKMNVAQGKIVIGISVNEDEKNHNEEAINIYNAILGGGANSKLFQNVREKASLAYTAGSRYVKSKNNIFIRCGIEIKNYEKTVNIIKEQLKDMEEGKFEEEDIKNAQELITAGLNSIKDEQASEISYYMNKSITGDTKSLDEIIEKINKIKKEEIINVAKKMKINTIYFLRD